MDRKCLIVISYKYTIARPLTVCMQHPKTKLYLIYTIFSVGPWMGKLERTLYKFQKSYLVNLETSSSLCSKTMTVDLKKVSFIGPHVKL